MILFSMDEELEAAILLTNREQGNAVGNGGSVDLCAGTRRGGGECRMKHDERLIDGVAFFAISLI